MIEDFMGNFEYHEKSLEEINQFKSLMLKYSQDGRGFVFNKNKEPTIFLN